MRASVGAPVAGAAGTGDRGGYGWDRARCGSARVALWSRGQCSGAAGGALEPRGSRGLMSALLELSAERWNCLFPSSGVLLF